MALAVAVTNRVKMQNAVMVVGRITASGSYATGGDALALTTLSGLLRSPIKVEIEGKAGYKYEWDSTNAKMLTRYGGAAVSQPMAEIPAAAYPAGVTGDVITFTAIYA